MIVLYDDNRIFKNNIEYTLLKNHSEAMSWLESISVDVVIDQLWLDHDLGMTKGRIETTMPFVKEIVRRVELDDNPLTINEILVHSSNVVGGHNIVKQLEKYYKTVRIPSSEYLIVDWPIIKVN